MALALLLACRPSPAHAQHGDHAGEAQPPPPKEMVIPPAPVLSPGEELASFRLAPGFRLELAAAEPLVEDPVAASFDADGRLWVVEMRGYMPDADGRGENAPTGRIVVLTDADGDGRFDARTIFLDGLVLPRAVAPTRDGALVAAPPHLWFCRDRDGDGVADERLEVDGAYGVEGNPEHKANGLLWALDNWNYSANHEARYRLRAGRWVREETAFRGQWGLSQDDWGRLFYDGNSDQFRGDLVPSAPLGATGMDEPPGLNVQFAASQDVWPARVTPGINRGYQPAMLRGGRLRTFTAACAPTIYRGDQFPAELRGCGFVCEPAGNLVRCNRLTETGGMISATNFFDHAEFLASTDERFRPVNLANGPDGALYVVDMYRGLIQHKEYLTTFLRKQVEARGLDKPIGLGRIWRVVHDGPRAPGWNPGLSRTGTGDLVRALAHSNGWWRDTAQRLLVERGDPAAGAPLRALAARGATPQARVHALWALEGLEALDREAIRAALRDPEPRVRATGVRLAAEWQGGALLGGLTSLPGDPDPGVRLHLAWALGSTGSAPPAVATAALSHVEGLTKAERARFDRGRGLFVQFCSSCHRTRGQGQAGLAPPLAGSEWAVGPAGRPIRIVLHGLAGPLTVKGRAYSLDMAGRGSQMDDEAIASVLTFVRRSWGNTASPVAPADVAAVRRATRGRAGAWSAAELAP